MAWNNIIHHPSNIIHLIHIFHLQSSFGVPLVSFGAPLEDL